jgi:hypothetical protein
MLLNLAGINLEEVVFYNVMMLIIKTLCSLISPTTNFGLLHIYRGCNHIQFSFRKNFNKDNVYPVSASAAGVKDLIYE